MGYRNKVKVINKEEIMEDNQLNRDSAYRIAALYIAVSRASQDSGIHGETVDVYALAESNYAWLSGKGDTKKPTKEKLKKTKGL